MRELFSKELSVFKFYKSLRLEDLNLIGVLFAFLIMLINLLNNNINLVPTIGLIGIILFIIFLILLVIFFSNKISETELHAFIAIQILLLFIYFIVISVFPLTLQWLKVFLSSYIVYNFFLFTITGFRVKKIIKLPNN